MNMLATKISVREVRKALQNLPKDTDDLYDETMKRVEEQSEDPRKLAYQALSWIVHANRPLTLKELQHALAVSSDLEMTELGSDSLVDENILTSVCAGLIIVEKRSSIVRLVRE
jgi:hypothetical protein